MLSILILQALPTHTKTFHKLKTIPVPAVNNISLTLEDPVGRYSIMGSQWDYIAVGLYSITGSLWDYNGLSVA